MTLELGEYTVTFSAVRDTCSAGMIEDTKSFLCELACFLLEAEARYTEHGLHALARRSHRYSLAIHNDLEAVGCFEEVE